MTNKLTNEEYERLYQLFVAKLKDARKEAGLTQVEVAYLLQTTQSYISKYERGDLRLDVIQLLAFARIYDKSIAYFVEEIE